ncbi:hypothetical protein [Mucilaginibacter sp.]
MLTSKLSRPFNQIIRANWNLEHSGGKFIIRRYELSMPQNIIPQ